MVKYIYTNCKHMPFTPLGDTLKDKMNSQTPLQKQVETSQIIEHAQKALKDTLGEEAKKARPLFLKNRTLTISCNNSVVAQEVRLLQEDIIQKINDKLGKKEVDRIRYLL